MKLPEDLRGTRLYFAYGSNMSAKQVDDRGLKMTPVGIGRLINYKLMFNKMSTKDPSIGFANIVPWWGSVVYGLIYDMSNLPIKERSISSKSKPEQEKIVSLIRNNLRILDKHEGYPSNYQRTNIGVLVNVLNEDKNVQCFTYIAGIEKQASSNLFINESYIEKITEGLDNNKINEDYKTEVKQLMKLWKATT